MKKTILLTGTTGAIGKATALELAKGDNKLILLGRNRQKLDALKAELFAVTKNNDIDIIIADLGESASLKQAAQEVKKKYASLNALVNIAAIYNAKRATNSKELELMFATNQLGPYILTNELLDLLKAGKPSRVINVSAPSFTKLKFDDLQGEKKYSALYSFGASKMMNLMFTYALSRRLEGTGVTTTVFDPGAVKTNLTKDMPAFLKLIFAILATKPDKPAATLSRLATDPAYDNNNGKFIKFNGKEIKPSAYSSDKELQEKLWTICEGFSKL
jgi:NAD(P)-dependent dehydrogenase (short-subunit alcohol dehydrogenase family)